MKATNTAIELIKSFEQLRLNSYLCPAGVWTIGYGHTDGVNQGMLITEKTADGFLKQDIQKAEDEVNRIKNNNYGVEYDFVGDGKLDSKDADAVVKYILKKK